MKKLLIASAMSVFVLGACTRVPSGTVGVETSKWNKKVSEKELDPDIHFTILSQVEIYSSKTITVSLMDMQPKAGDDLTLQDFDIEIHYTVNPAEIAEMSVKYSDKDVQMRNIYTKSEDPNNGKDPNVWLSGYNLVRSHARSSAYSIVAKNDSLTIHAKRPEIAASVKSDLQNKLDEINEGYFTITEVIIRDVKPDPSIEKQIQESVAIEKEAEREEKKAGLLKQQALNNAAISQSLTPEVLALRKIEAIEKVCGAEGSTCILSIDGSGVAPTLNLRN